MSVRPRNVDGLREELLAKEKELSSVQEFLLEQDNDLRSCFHQVGDFELKLLANRPDSRATNIGCETSTPRTLTLPRDELMTSGDARAATALSAQGNITSSYSAGNNNDSTSASNHSTSASNNSTSACIASRNARNNVYLASSSPSAGPLASASSAPSPDDGSSSRRRLLFVESSACRAAVVDKGPPDAPETPPYRNPEHERRHCRAGDGGSNPEEFRQRVSNGVGMVGLTASSVAPEPRHAPAASPYAPPSRPAAVVAAAAAAAASAATAAAAAAGCAGCAPSASSDEQRLRVSPCRMSTRRAESGGGGGRGEATTSSETAAGAGASTRIIGTPHRLAEDRSSFQEQGRREPEGDANRFTMELALAERDERVAHAERRARAAEAAERSAAASAVTAMRGARAAKEEAERLRVEGLELSRWREAVLDLRDALRFAERDGEGRGDGGDRSDDDPVARHAQWVSSPALGTLLPHLQQGARDLLTDLIAARARVPAPPTTETATSSPVTTRPSGGGTTHIAAAAAAADSRGCTCAPTVAEQRSRDEARSDAACMGEARGDEAHSRIRSVEMQSRRGKQQCATCTDVPNGADCSRRGASCGGDGDTKGAGSAAAAGGLGVGHGVVEKSAASLEKECETLRIVVQALHEKEEDSQKRIASLEEGMLQASLAAVERDALVSVLRRQLAPRDSYASDAAEEGNGSRGRTRSCTRGRAGFKGSMDAVCTPEQDVPRGERSGPRSRLFADGGVVVEPSPPPSTRLPRSGWDTAASVVGDESRCRRLSSSMLRSELQPDQSPRGPRQECAHSNLDSSCPCHQAEACSFNWAGRLQADPDPSRDDSRYPPCDGNCGRERIAVKVVPPAGQAPPSTPQNAAPKTARCFTGTPPTFALRGGYRDRRGGGGGGGKGCGAEADPACSERTPRTAKKEKRHGDPQVPTPTTDVIRRLLYESTPPASQMEHGRGSTGRMAVNGRRLFSEGCTPGDPGDAVGVRGDTSTAAMLFSDSPCKQSGGSDDLRNDYLRGGSGSCGMGVRGRGSGSRGMGARDGRNGNGRVEVAMLPARGNGGGVPGCSVGEATASAMAGGRIAKGELVLRERLLQARRDFSALRTGVPADELS